MPGKPADGQQCTATSKRTGERCEAWKVKGMEVCYHHGGRSLAGSAHPSYLDGRRSKYRAIFTGDALEHYEFVRTDPQYIQLREEVAVLDTLILEELAAARIGQGGPLWEELEAVWRAFQEAGTKKNPAAAGKELRRLGELIRDGADRHRAQAAAVDLIERKRKVSDTERRRLNDEEQMISAARVMSFVGVLTATMREAIAGEPNERELLVKIHAGLTRVLREHTKELGGDRSNDLDIL